MNWQEVISSYPEAYSCLIRNNVSTNYIRDLYDFFDEQGINIFIDWMLDQTNHGKIVYYPKFLDWECKHSTGGIFPTRTEAEEQAFLRAFQILEEKLKS